MSYIEDIKTNENLTVDIIIEVAKNNLPASHVNIPWFYPGLDHGKAVLASEEQLNCYMASYGEMHKCKLEEAFKNFPFIDINDDLEIIDWGCGQGIASVFLIDKLKERNLIDKLKKVTLIEPSSAALKRAKFHIENSLSSEVEQVEKNVFLPTFLDIENDISDLFVEENICIHLFSNILDIANIDLKKLTSIISKTGYRHYFVCVGPYGPGKERIEGFFRYFNVSPNDVFSDCHSPSYGRIESGKWFGCVTKGFKLTREEGKPFLIPLSFYPPKEFAAAYQLDELGKIENSSLQDTLKYFDVLAPFDIGASVYEDVDPILAILNNIITRGIPTKCSPFVEDKFAETFSHTTREEENGTIVYKVKYNKLIEDNYEILQKSPVGIAWIQKLIIEAILTGKLSLNDEKWNIVIVEDRIPCAALALEDLKIIFNNLCKLSRDYKELKFPDLNLQIVNSISQDSLLHLNNKVVASKKKIKKENIYDLVIEINFENSIDPESVQFSEFKVKNYCYFKISPSQRKAHRYILTSDRIKYSPLTELDSSGVHNVIEEQAQILRFFLQLLFRKVDFRPGQLPILNRALQNKGVIGLLPTGGGKSLTYQLAAMLQPGITVIIDPLKSLMMDQYEGLLANGIDACTYINSDLDFLERAKHEGLMENSEVLFVFMSPERLCIYSFRERLRNMKELGVYFSYGVIDEVHCVSEWGHDFRPSYLHLGRNLYSYVNAKDGEISLFGLTATASFDVLSDVERELSGHESFSIDPETIVRYENTNRLELQYKIERIEAPFQEDKKFNDNGILSSRNLPMPIKFTHTRDIGNIKKEYLKTLIPKIPGYLRELQTEKSIETIVDRFKEREDLGGNDATNLSVEINDDFLNNNKSYQHAGIIFCPHVNNTGLSVAKNTESLSEIAEVGSFSGADILDQENKSMENMALFRDNKLPLMVATKAFGMGIDKPNVRFTVNMNFSSSLESFVQEAGRAGRDKKIALSLILMTDYRLARINYRTKNINHPIPTIKGRWFKEEDLQKILNSFGVSIDKSDIDICDPVTDMVRLVCPIAKSYSQSDDGKISMIWQWPCNKCFKYKECSIKSTHPDYQYKWMYYKDLVSYLRQNRIRFHSENIEYQNYDYSNVMFFFNQNFKGEQEEKQKMHELLSLKEIRYFIGNTKEYNEEATKTGKGFMEPLFACKVGEEMVVWISYEEESYQDVAKAIYRMCMIGLIDDFTQDYNKNCFRIVAVRKRPGAYYQRLKEFLKRYYSEERAENEVEMASIRKGQNEIHRCLGYLTEFVYDTVARKRKRAIDDMRSFCITGINQQEDWKTINEDLKDEIFFYFNSKFAREDYVADNNEPFSLKDDVIKYHKNDFDLLFKYMRVMDAEIMGGSGSPIDNIKHLRGAVRLIRRSDPDNPFLNLLNVFCLLVLCRPENQNIIREMEDSFTSGYQFLKNHKNEFPTTQGDINRFFVELNKKDRNAANAQMLDQLRHWKIRIDLNDINNLFDKFTKQYTE